MKINYIIRNNNFKFLEHFYFLNRNETIKTNLFLRTALLYNNIIFKVDPNYFSTIYFNMPIYKKKSTIIRLKNIILNVMFKIVYLSN